MLKPLKLFCASCQHNPKKSWKKIESAKQRNKQSLHPVCWDRIETETESHKFNRFKNKWKKNFEKVKDTNKQFMQIH